MYQVMYIPGMYCVRLCVVLPFRASAVRPG